MKRTRRAPKRKRPTPPKRPPKRKTPKRKVTKRSRSLAAKRGWETRRRRARSLAAKKGWETRRARQRSPARARVRERERDVEIVSEGAPDVAADYRAYPVPTVEDRTPDYVGAIETAAESVGEDLPQIDWLPTFDEVYDYIDGLAEEYDLDPHDLFELAFGYAKESEV